MLTITKELSFSCFLESKLRGLRVRFAAPFFLLFIENIKFYLIFFSAAHITKQKRLGNVMGFVLKEQEIC